MVKRALFLVTLAAVWGFAVWRAGGVVGFDRKVFLLALGIAGLGYWLVNRRGAAPMPALLRWSACLLPAYVALQLVPLPAGVLAILSPARLELLRAVSALSPGERAATLSVAPGITMNHFLLACGYALVFFLTYQMAAAWGDRRWVLILPLAVIAGVEAALGTAQALSGHPAHGTYIDRDHYAGLLEMVLPFTLVYPIYLWRQMRARGDFSLRPALPVCLFAGVAVLIFTGSLLSLSRMGFIAPLFSVLVMGIVAWGGNGWRSAAIAALLGSALIAGFVFLPSDQLIARFAQSGSELGAGGRLTLWRESLNLFRAFPAFGCGLGGFESAFLRYKVSTPMVGDDHPHNDYLQFLIELGIAGFLIGAALFAAILFKTARAAAPGREPRHRFLAIASIGAFAAIGLHSFVDFNLYIPANAMLLAWIAGVASSLEGAGQLQHTPERNRHFEPAQRNQRARRTY